MNTKKNSFKSKQQFSKLDSLWKIDKIRQIRQKSVGKERTNLKKEIFIYL